jgi:multidrug efflux system outer membrane protein
MSNTSMPRNRHVPLLYDKGLESFLPVLDGEHSLYAADDQLAQSGRNSALALITLYKSLGGWWLTASAHFRD